MRSLAIACAALGEVTIESGSLSEEISAPTRATLRIAAAKVLDPAEIVGEQAVMTLEVDDSVKRRFPLAIVRARADELDVEGRTYLLEL